MVAYVAERSSLRGERRTVKTHAPFAKLTKLLCLLCLYLYCGRLDSLAFPAVARVRTQIHARLFIHSIAVVLFGKLNKLRGKSARCAGITKQDVGGMSSVFTHIVQIHFVYPIILLFD